ncbi:hypothetical protein ACOSP7_001384 [Xanthoceras sorbifolium]
MFTFTRNAQRSGCTFIPGSGGAPCTTQRNFAGRHVVPPPPVYPDDQVIAVGVHGSY